MHPHYHVSGGCILTICGMHTRYQWHACNPVRCTPNGSTPRSEAVSPLPADMPSLAQVPWGRTHKGGPTLLFDATHQFARVLRPGGIVLLLLPRPEAARLQRATLTPMHLLHETAVVVGGFPVSVLALRKAEGVAMEADAVLGELGAPVRPLAPHLPLSQQSSPPAESPMPSTQPVLPPPSPTNLAHCTQRHRHAAVTSPCCCAVIVCEVLASRSLAELLMDVWPNLVLSQSAAKRCIARGPVRTTFPPRPMSTPRWQTCSAPVPPMVPLHFVRRLW